MLTMIMNYLTSTIFSDVTLCSLLEVYRSSTAPHDFVSELHLPIFQSDLRFSQGGYEEYHLLGYDAV
jgi:hypothetical protein